MLGWLSGIRSQTYLPVALVALLCIIIWTHPQYIQFVKKQLHDMLVSMQKPSVTLQTNSTHAYNPVVVSTENRYTNQEAVVVNTGPLFLHTSTGCDELPRCLHRAENHDPQRLAKGAVMSSDAFMQCADHYWSPGKKPGPISHGDIIWVAAASVGRFFRDFFPHIPTDIRIVLVSHGTLSPPRCPDDVSHDKSKRLFKGNCGWFQHKVSRYLPRLTWFALNRNWEHPNIRYIPLGWKSHNTRKGDQCPAYKIVQNASMYGDETKRDIFLFTGWMQTYTRQRVPERWKALAAAKKIKSSVALPGPIPFDEYLTYMTRAVFALSPQGKGIDCHRTWEALAMGAIPVVAKEPIADLYVGLPIVVVENWVDLTEDLLKNKLQELKPTMAALAENAKRTLDACTWIEKIKLAQREMRAEANNGSSSAM
eukprot:TRINITY_DN66355_c9_g1_i1.p1 TRINITY_DN66355_c9_g1~~TRINITY_DN66355_c9_g1_i1.p1  ORF type:complete len:423 (-),score=2.98 TRINITY_DN66355_c9_g1_i1:75-1343(-)